MKKIIVSLMAFSIIFLTGFVANAEEKSNIPEFLTEVVNRCSTDVSYIETSTLACENSTVTIYKAYYRDINTYRKEIEAPEVEDGNFIDIVHGKKRYLYNSKTMALETFGDAAPNLLQLIGNSKVITRGSAYGNCVDYEFIDDRGEKHLYVVDKIKKILILTISFEKNGKEFGRNIYSHWKFEKQPDDLFNEKLLQVKK